jgi:hypothetical protein
VFFFNSRHFYYIRPYYQRVPESVLLLPALRTRGRRIQQEPPERAGPPGQPAVRPQAGGGRPGAGQAGQHRLTAQDVRGREKIVSIFYALVVVSNKDSL